MKYINEFEKVSDFQAFMDENGEGGDALISYIVETQSSVLKPYISVPTSIIFYIDGIEQNDATSNMTWCEYAQMRREIDGWEDIHCTEDDVTFDYVDGMVQLGVQYVTLNGERVKGDDIIQNGGQYTLEVVLFQP